MGPEQSATHLERRRAPLYLHLGPIRMVVLTTLIAFMQEVEAGGAGALGPEQPEVHIRSAEPICGCMSATYA